MQQHSGPAVLLDDLSPYGSRRVVVEYDGATTAAYLHASTGPVAAAWIANHLRAPASPDPAALRTGEAPLMPAAHTRHPAGRPPLDPAALTAVWLEEGDGVAILEHGELLAVLPGWADLAGQRPGYSRDVIGQTPFGWSLAGMGGLEQRVRRSARFWQWQAGPDGWQRYAGQVQAHLDARLGPAGEYWDVAGGQLPAAGVSERPPAPGRRYTVLSTVGMSCQRMPGVEQTGPDAVSRARIELALATTMPAAEAARVFLWLAQLPWREVTWLGPGKVVPWYDEPATFPLGGGRDAVLLTDQPGALPGPPVPPLEGLRAGSEPVRWLWVIPVGGRERRAAAQRGPAGLTGALAARRRPWVWTGG